MCRERAHERGPDELRLFLVQCGKELRHHPALRVVLEVCIRDGAKAVVRADQRFAHRVGRAGIVESREQHESAVAHVAVGMFGHRLKERGHRLSCCRAPDRPRGVRTDGVVEITELVDRGFELRGRNGLRRARLLREADPLTAEDAEDTEKKQALTLCVLRVLCGGEFRQPTDHFATGSLSSSFSASWR